MLSFLPGDEAKSSPPCKSPGFPHQYYLKTRRLSLTHSGENAATATILCTVIWVAIATLALWINLGSTEPIHRRFAMIAPKTSKQMPPSLPDQNRPRLHPSRHDRTATVPALGT
jgi:hypothetical protein